MTYLTSIPRCVSLPPLPLPGLCQTRRLWRRGVQEPAQSYLAEPREMPDQNPAVRAPGLASLPLPVGAVWPQPAPPGVWPHPGTFPPSQSASSRFIRRARQCWGMGLSSRGGRPRALTRWPPERRSWHTLTREPCLCSGRSALSSSCYMHAGVVAWGDLMRQKLSVTGAGMLSFMPHRPHGHVSESGWHERREVV